MSEPTASAAPAAPAPTGIAAIEALLAPFHRSDSPGLVIGVAQHGKTLLRRGYGLASLEHGVANTPVTRMRIASTSKQFAALAVLLLAEDGRLSIDDPVHQHLPQLPSFAPNSPTLRQLMHHTSGWRSDAELSAIAHGLALQPKGAGMALMRVQSQLNFAPGSGFMYSNGGYRLLATVVETVSGQSFEAFLAERIFLPLGMLDTASVPSDLEVHPRLAGLYQPAVGGGWRKGLYPMTETGGSGSMISTVDDMLRWMAHLRADDKRVGSAATWAQMLAPTVLDTGTVIEYGMGLMRERYRGVDTVHHSGGWIGGSSQMITVPAHGLDIIVIANGLQQSPARLALKVIDALLAEHLDAPTPYLPASRHPELVGQRYHAPSTGAVVDFIELSGLLCLSWIGSNPAPLRESELGPWLACQDIAVGPFEIDATGWTPGERPAAIRLLESGHPRRMERVAPEDAPTVAAMAELLAGRYRVPDLNGHATVALRDGRLVMRVQGEGGAIEVYLDPMSDDLLRCTALDPLLAIYGGGYLTLERRDGVVTDLRMDNARTRHLRFERVTREETLR